MTVNNMGPGMTVAELKNLTAIRQAQQSQASMGLINHRSNHKLNNISVKTRNNCGPDFRNYTHQRPPDIRIAPISGHSGVFTGIQSPPVIPHAIIPHQQHCGDFDPKIPDANCTAYPPLGRPQSSGRITQGLTVEELKEMTKLRLKSQGYAQLSSTMPIQPLNQSMRRVASMPYSGCGSTINPKVKYPMNNTEIHQNRRQLSKLHSCENIISEYSLQHNLDERMSRVTIGNSSPKVLSQSASHCSTPENNGTLGSSSVSPASPVNFSSLDTLLNRNPSLSNSPQYPILEENESSLLSFVKYDSFSNKTDQMYLPNEYADRSDVEENVRRVHSKYDIFADSRDLFSTSHGASSISHISEKSFKDRIDEKEQKSPASHRKSVSFKKEDKMGSRRPSHLRINSVDAFPADHALEQSATAKMSSDLFDDDGKSCDTPSIKSAIAMQVAEFALQTPVANDSGKSPALSTKSLEWNYDNITNTEMFNCDTSSARWRSSTFSAADSNWTQSSTVLKSGLFSFNCSRETLHKAKSAIGFPKYDGFNNADASINEFNVLTDNAVNYRSSKFSSTKYPSCGVFDIDGRSRNGSSITSLPSYSSTSFAPTPSSVVTFKGATSYLNEVNQNANPFWDVSENYGNFGQQNQENVPTPIYTQNTWPENYHI